MGLETHICAGAGDAGFCGYWTLEIKAVTDIVLYPGMPIGQLVYHSIDGEVTEKYGDRQLSYNNLITDNPMPVIPNLYAKPYKFYNDGI